MKKWCIVFIIILGILWKHEEVFAQKEMKVNFDYGVRFKTSENTKKLETILLLPQDIENKQKVVDINYSQEPAEIYEKNGNKYARFILQQLKDKEEILINITMSLYPADYRTLSKNKEVKVLDEEIEKYLQPEKHIESDNERIIKKANELKGKNQLQTLRKIYNFVLSHIDYSWNYPQPFGAISALETQKGDGGEFTNLFVALCRASDIPARYVYGYITDFSNSPLHMWAEVYVEDIGWTIFEVIPGNDATFNSTLNRYVCLSIIKNDDELRNYAYYSYRTWGEDVEEHSNFFKLNWKK